MGYEFYKLIHFLNHVYLYFLEQFNNIQFQNHQIRLLYKKKSFNKKKEHLLFIPF